MGEQDHNIAPTSQQQSTPTVSQTTAATPKSDTPDNSKEMTQATTQTPAEQQQPTQQQASAPPKDGGQQEPQHDQSIEKAKQESSEGQRKQDQPQSQSGQPQPGQPQSEQLEPEPQAPIDNSHAPPIGTKIQVLWRIIHESNNNNSNSNADAMNTDSTNEATGNTELTSGPMEEQRWWGAVVQERTSEKVGIRSIEIHKDLDVHILLYDAYGDFEEEVVRVAFLPDNVLLDLSMLDDADGGRLDWRLESDAMNDEDDEESATAVRSAECLAREADQIVQLSGISADADLQALARMPHEVQLHVASGYRSFADAIKSLLGELVASKPADYVVTAQDVQEIMARVRSQRQGQSGTLTGTAAQ